MKLPRKSAALASLGALLAVLLMGCGGDGAAEGAAGGPASAETGAPADQPDPAPEAGTEAECDLPEGLAARLNLQRQLVLSVASSGGENLEAVQSTNPLEPELFRSLADTLDGLDLSGVAANPHFDPPEDVVADLRKTADLLQAALDAGSDSADPAWRELSEFYTEEFFTRHNASVSYYLSEAGCV